jgi:hypothetical protein
MQADVPYAFYSDEILDFFQLAPADNRDREILVPGEPLKNCSAAGRELHIVRVPPQTHQRPVKIKQQKPVLSIANPSDHLRPRTSQIAHIAYCTPLASR